MIRFVRWLAFCSLAISLALPASAEPIARKVKDTYYRLFYQEQGVRIIDRNIALLDDIIRLTETRYQVGKGLLQDVLKAQVERSKPMDKLFTWKQMHASVLAELNTLCDLPTAKPLTPSVELDMTPVELSLRAKSRSGSRVSKAWFRSPKGCWQAKRS